MTPRPDLLGALRARGLLHQHSEGLGAHFAAGSVSAYCGFDPTAPSLHVGNLIPAMGLLRLADAGHRVVALVGGGTALIGDPSGKSAERPLLSAADVRANGAAIASQLRRVLGDRVAVADNADWLQPLGLVEFLRDTGKHFPINQMLAKDTVRTRLETGISFTEFSYMLLQAYDFVQLRMRHGVTVQLGGSDQWGNITAGIELVRRTGNGEAHGLTFPLLTTASGKKFGKTEGGAVWLDAALTSPYQFFQFWINTDDADVGRFLRLFTLLPDEEIAAIEARHATAPHERMAQRVLAHDVTARVHSTDAARDAQAASTIVFDKRVSPADIADSVYEMLSAEIPRVVRARGDLGVAEVLEAAFGVSRSAARKLVQQGAVSANGVKLTPDMISLDPDAAVRGRWLLLRKGGRDTALLVVE